MCGRYVSPDEASIEREFNLVRSEFTFPPSYNVAPTQQVPVVRIVGGGRQGLRMRWGLIPFFAKGEPPKYSTINARVETMETAASYRGPWRRGQRCLQVALGFFEWHTDDAGRKAPHYIRLNDQDVFGFAALWDRSVKPDGVAIESVVHITMPGNDLMKHVHNAGGNPFRMPAIVAKEDREAWLAGSIEEALKVLKPYDQTHMVHYEVTAAVNSPKNNTSVNIEPVVRPGSQTTPQRGVNA
jgi:putative SOS response-associated peptidase YedK